MFWGNSSKKKKKEKNPEMCGLVERQSQEDLIRDLFRIRKGERSVFERHFKGWINKLSGVGRAL